MELPHKDVLTINLFLFPVVYNKVSSQFVKAILLGQFHGNMESIGNFPFFFADFDITTYDFLVLKNIKKMAEMFLFRIVERVLEKIDSVTLQEIGLAWRFKSELNKLVDTLATLEAVLSDAEEQQAKNRQLSVWLGKLKDVCYDAEDVLDEFDYQALQRQVVTHGSFKRKVRNFISLSNLKFHFKMGHKLKEIRERLDGIAAEKAKFLLHEQVEDRRVVHMERETHSFVHASDVIGRDEDKEHIVQFLMHSCDHENVSVIPIIGIGGLGKTTLAKLVYNDKRVVGHFQLKIWVCVSEDFDVKKLTREIINSAAGINCGNLTMDEMQTRLRNTLRDKTFLLVLDDVWNEDRGKWIELKNLLIAGASGSKIIVTTRNQSVALIMGTAPVYKLEGLSHGDCMSLFVKWTFREGEEKQYPNLLEIGDKIVKKCGGVPLAVKTLGSLLYLKTDVCDWLFIKDNEVWRLEQKKNDILPALQLSYNAMPSYLKQCFACCSIFPKDFEFRCIELIQLWMAHGLLQPCNENQEWEDIGKQYLRELCSRSFFQDVEVCYFYLKFKMHDLIHDLALSVAQSETFIVTLRTHNIPKRVRHVSFSEEKYSSLDEVPSFLLGLNKLRTIMIPVELMGPTSTSFVERCISRFEYLRVLYLSDSCLKVLPSSIGNLKHLRLLNLYGNGNIKKLPNSICNLLNLQTLRLVLCSKLEELPRDIGNLTSLRWLSITTKQMFFPEEGIGRLISLRFLWIGKCGNLRSLGEGVQRLTALRTLAIADCESLEDRLSHCLKYLTALETLVILNCEKLDLTEGEQDTQGHRLSLRSLFIINLEQLVALPEWLQGAANTLQNISIRDCFNLVTLPEWLQNLTSLEKLTIRNCPELSSLPEGMHRLTALRELEIAGCPELSRKCRQDSCKDWPKFTHAFEMTIDGKRIKSN